MDVGGKRGQGRLAMSGPTPFKPASKTGVKSHGLKFIPPTAETPEAIISDLEHIHSDGHKVCNKIYNTYAHVTDCP